MSDEKKLYQQASEYAESKCSMCHGVKNLPLEHCCGRIKEGFLTGARAQTARLARLEAALKQVLHCKSDTRCKQCEHIAFAALDAGGGSGG